MESHKPLFDLAESPASAFERVLDFIPVVGWCIATRLEVRRRAPKANYIVKQLLNRDSSIWECWGDDPNRRHVAKVISEAIQREYQWPNNLFLPEDRIDLLMWTRGGYHGGQVAYVLMEIFVNLRIKLQISDFEPYTMMFGELVDRVSQKKFTIGV